jgi:hypothetical protein
MAVSADPSRVFAGVQENAPMLIYGMFEGFMQPLRRDVSAPPASGVKPGIVTAFVVLIFFGILAAIWF